MNALERTNLIADLEESIGDWGLSESLEAILESKGYELEKLDRHTLAAIDERFFSCDVCGWTHTVDEMGETEVGDGHMCQYCEAVAEVG